MAELWLHPNAISRFALCSASVLSKYVFLSQLVPLLYYV